MISRVGYQLRRPLFAYKHSNNPQRQFTQPLFYSCSAFRFNQFCTSTDPQAIKRLIKEAYNKLDAFDSIKADESFSLALDQLSKQASPDPLDKAQALIGLASVSTVKGQAEKAIEYLKEAEAAAKLSKTDDKEILSHICYLLGRNLRQIGNFEDALKYGEQAINIQESSNAVKDNKLALMYYNVGVAHRQLGDQDKAKTRLLKSVDCFNESSSQEDPQLSFVYHELGTLLSERQEYNDAVVYLEQARRLFEKDKNIRGSLKAELYYYLGVGYEETNSTDRAITFYIKATEYAKTEVTEEASNLVKSQIASILEGVGQRLMRLNKFESALEPLLVAFKLYEKLGDEYKQSLSVISHCIGIIYGNLDEMEESVTYLNKALQYKIAVLGPEHEEVAFIYQSLGTSLFSVDEFEDAVNCLQAALAIFSRRLGDNNPMCTELKATIQFIKNHAQSNPSS